jgi:undecaprenyl-diphosphatase
MALLWFYGYRWVRLARGAVRTAADRSLDDADGRLAWLIVLGTVPAAVIGFLFQDVIEDALRSPWLVATMLIAFSGVFLLAEAVGKRVRTEDDMRWPDAVFIGFAQAVALVPGVSRSGATISAGLVRDMERPQAADFAFLLSAPIIGGAGSVETARFVRDVVQGDLGGEEVLFFATGFVCAAVVGYLAIGFLLRFLTTNSLLPFVYYRVALGLLVYVLLIAGVL